jgi:hypothetical protein
MNHQVPKNTYFLVSLFVNRIEFLIFVKKLYYGKIETIYVNHKNQRC